MKKTVMAAVAASSMVAGYVAYDQYDLRVDKPYIVMLKPGASGGSELEALANDVGEVEGPLDGLNGYIVKTDKNRVRAFSVPSEEYILEPLIEYKIPDIIKSAGLPGGCGFEPPLPPDPEPPSTDDPEVVDWGVDRVRVLDKPMEAREVSVCVLDTGIDRGHPDLAYMAGRNFTTNNADDFQDRQGHGTHTAGLVGAIDNDFGVVGSSQAQLLIGKVLSDQGSGYNSWISAGIVWCADAGADIISMSLGGPQRSAAIESALSYAIDRGALILAAAGNDGSPSVGYPAGYVFPGKLFSVAATNRSDDLAYFSNYGKIEMSCPGVGILSTVPGGYDSFSGTSMATPICAGVMARYLSINKEPSFDDIGDAYYFGDGLITGDGLF